MTGQYQRCGRVCEGPLLPACQQLPGCRPSRSIGSARMPSGEKSRRGETGSPRRAETRCLR